MTGHAALVLSLAGLAALAIACSGGKADTVVTVERVIPAERVFTFDDISAAGAKKGKQYDVTGLRGATSAYLMFFGPNPSARKDYEIRLYPSHEVAVRDGQPLAEEGVGEGMKARKDTQSWKEGERDRWLAGGVTDVSSPGSRQAPGPKYWDYVIFGNVVMLCQGLDAQQSLENCSALVEAMGGRKLF
ncbi:MAG: hypothetical protein FJ314_04160 [SAR202 cluster bacterium]|nr:hypothetical protein [SAR202 cluster bacterium]